MARLDVDIELIVKGLQELEKVGGQLDATEQKTTKLGAAGQGVFQGMGQAVAGFGIGLAKAGIDMAIDAIGSSIDLASDKAEAASKAQIIFGDSYQTVSDKANTAAEDVGVSSGKYLELAGNVGNLVTNFGFAGDEAANMSTDIVQLSADVGSFNNAPTEQVVEAIGAAFRGESEPIRKFGVMLDDATIKAKAMELGLYDGAGALDKTAKATATYQLILEQTSNAQGDFARTADGYANSQKIAGAKIDEAMTRVGEVLLPLAGEVMPMLADALGVMVDLFMDGVEAIQNIVEQFKFLQPVLDVIAGAARLVSDAWDDLNAANQVTVDGLDELKPKFDEVAAAAGLTAEETVAAWDDVAQGIADGSVRGDEAVQQIIASHREAAASADDLRESSAQSGQQMALDTERDSQAVADAWLQASQDAVKNMDMGLRDGSDVIEAKGIAWQNAQKAVSDRMIEEAADLGRAIPSEIGEGMVEKSREVLDAADRLVDLLENGLSPGEQAARLMGEKYTKAVAAGVKSEIPGAKEAAQQVAVAAINTIEDAGEGKTTKGMKAMGEYYDALLASGLSAAAARAALAAAGVASDSIDALEGKANGFENAGDHVGDAWVDGFASAVKAGQLAIDRAVTIATRATHGESPPKEGPLKEIDRWGANVFGAWIKGGAEFLTGGGRGQVSDALARVFPAALGDSPALSVSAGAAGSPGVLGSGRDVHIHLYGLIGDPVETGRQIKKALGEYERTSGTQAE